MGGLGRRGVGGYGVLMFKSNTTSILLSKITLSPRLFLSISRDEKALRTIRMITAPKAEHRKSWVTNSPCWKSQKI